MHTSIGLRASRLLLVTMGIGLVASAQAQTHIFVQNDTTHAFSIKGVDVSGANISAKAWKQSVAEVAGGQRNAVLTITRAGKVNWMDPTSRFIEPGKTVTFSTTVSLASASGNPIVLRQKLLGTGESSKMWHSLAGTENSQQWHIDESAHQGTWVPSDATRFDILYRAYRDKDETHVEYIFSSPK